MLLNDEEINDLDNELVDIPEWINETDEYTSWLFSKRYFAKAQLKKVVRWGEGYCAEQNRPKRECGHCWQALLEETK